MVEKKSKGEDCTGNDIVAIRKLVGVTARVSTGSQSLKDKKWCCEMDCQWKGCARPWNVQTNLVVLAMEIEPGYNKGAGNKLE